jgi:hypothetical protein
MLGCFLTVETVRESHYKTGEGNVEFFPLYFVVYQSFWLMSFWVKFFAAFSMVLKLAQTILCFLFLF